MTLAVIHNTNWRHHIFGVGLCSENGMSCPRLLTDFVAWYQITQANCNLNTAAYQYPGERRWRQIELTIDGHRNCIATVNHIQTEACARIVECEDVCGYSYKFGFLIFGELYTTREACYSLVRIACVLMMKNIVNCFVYLYNNLNTWWTCCNKPYISYFHILYCRYVLYVSYFIILWLCMYLYVLVMFGAQIERTKARARNLNSKPYYREALQIIPATKTRPYYEYILNPKGV